MSVQAVHPSQAWPPAAQQLPSPNAGEALQGAQGGGGVGCPCFPRQCRCRQLRHCCLHRWGNASDPHPAPALCCNECMRRGASQGGAVCSRNILTVAGSVVRDSAMLYVPLCRWFQAPCSSSGSNKPSSSGHHGCAGQVQQQQVQGVRKHTSPARLSQWCSVH